MEYHVSFMTCGSIPVCTGSILVSMFLIPFLDLHWKVDVLNYSFYY